VYKSGMLRLAHEVQEILEEEARAALDAGWAEVRIEEGDLGPSLHLEPMKLEAAPLEIYFDSEELVLCSPGRHGVAVEFFVEDPAGSIKDRVRALVAAMVAGNYTERVGGGETVAEWPGPLGMERPAQSALGNAQAQSKSWRTISYEPY
jgi:hypothetical protein